MSTRLAISAAFLCGSLAAQTSALPPDILFLSKAIRHIREGIGAIPNYTCVETIAREQRKTNSSGFNRLDLVRLEVARVGSRELFGWPGARTLEDRPMSDFTAGGLIGNGVFSLFAGDLFVNNAGSMKVRGTENLDGRPVTRVDYSVHSLTGSLTLRTATASAAVNWSGSWWVDPRSLDLVRLDVNGDEIPPELQISAVRISIEYGSASIAIFPRSAVMELTDASGEISRDRIDFDNCRKFSGEAELILDSDDTAGADRPAPQPAQTFTLPEGLTIPLVLQTAIDVRTAGIGDELTAVVERDVRDKRKLWLPKGAGVHGRIRRLDRREGYELVGIEFSEAQSGNNTFEFVAQLDSAEHLPGLETNLGSQESPRAANFSKDIETTQVTRGYELEIPGTGYLYITSAPFRIPPDFHMVWKTQALRHQ